MLSKNRANKLGPLSNRRRSVAFLVPDPWFLIASYFFTRSFSKILQLRHKLLHILKSI